MSALTEQQKAIYQGLICPYCLLPTVHVESAEVYGVTFNRMMYLCRKCKSYVTCHKSEPTKSMGRLACAELRSCKMDAHAAFDPIWKSEVMTRSEAYEKISELLGIPIEYTHIGMFNIETCKKVINICNTIDLTNT